MPSDNHIEELEKNINELLLALEQIYSRICNLIKNSNNGNDNFFNNRSRLEILNNISNPQAAAVVEHASNSASGAAVVERVSNTVVTDASRQEMYEKVKTDLREKINELETLYQQLSTKQLLTPAAETQSSGAAFR